MSATSRPLTQEEKDYLATLNDAVNTAMNARREWLDAKAIEASRLQVGDDLYDVDSGVKVGVISELYRYTETSVQCDYRYEVAPLCFDNTSRQRFRSFGTHEDAIRHADGRAARLRSQLT